MVCVVARLWASMRMYSRRVQVSAISASGLQQQWDHAANAHWGNIPIKPLQSQTSQMDMWSVCRWPPAQLVSRDKVRVCSYALLLVESVRHYSTCSTTCLIVYCNAVHLRSSLLPIMPHVETMSWKQWLVQEASAYDIDPQPCFCLLSQEVNFVTDSVQPCYWLPVTLLPVTLLPVTNLYSLLVYSNECCYWLLLYGLVTVLSVQYSQEVTLLHFVVLLYSQKVNFVTCWVRLGWYYSTCNYMHVV